MKPVRIQRRRAKGWRLPDNTVVVDRSTPWGNPFVVGRDGNAARCVELYPEIPHPMTDVADRLEAIRERRIAEEIAASILGQRYQVGFRVTAEIDVLLHVAARKRGLGHNTLARLIVERVVARELFEQILDAP
jgi:hypothetical protein